MAITKFICGFRRTVDSGRITSYKQEHGLEQEISNGVCERDSSSASGSQHVERGIQDFPEDVLRHIFHYVGISSSLSSGLTGDRRGSIPLRNKIGTSHEGRAVGVPTTSNADTSGSSMIKNEQNLHLSYHHMAFNRKKYFAICGVCHSWRNIGREMFFTCPWSSPHILCHPNQLFCLSPRAPQGSRSGLLKCFVRREHDVSGSRQIFTLWMGKDHLQPSRSRFLMSVVQLRGRKLLFYLNRQCSGPPCASLESNFSSSRYELQLSNELMLFTDDGSDNEFLSTEECLKDDGDCRQNKESPTTINKSLKRLPNELGVIKYRSRMRGLLQPRRMEITLPNPSDLGSPNTLPILKRTTSVGCKKNSFPFRRTSTGISESVSTPKQTGLNFESDILDYYEVGVDRQDMSEQDNLEYPNVVDVEGILSNTEGESSGRVDDRTPTILVSEHSVSDVTRQAKSPKVIRSVLSAIRHNFDSKKVESDPEVLKPPSILLRNKSPHWNEAMRCWCLNFRGRVKLASVKNFQLVRADDPREKVVMQFGKVDTNVFILDFNPTIMSAAQAFACCLTTFPGKLIG